VYAPRLVARGELAGQLDQRARIREAIVETAAGM
jgi:hypothetical protein